MPKLDPDWIEGVVRNATWGLDRNNFWTVYQPLTSYLRDAAKAGSFGITMVEAVREQVEEHEKYATTDCGGLLRLMFRRICFTALRPADAALKYALPDADARYAHGVIDGIAKEEPLATLSKAQVQKLFFAWAPLDWDGTLGVASLFERELPKVAPLEKRPWADLVRVVQLTSLGRIDYGERSQQTMSRLFARDEPIEQRIALAENIAAFAKGNGKGDDSRDAMQAVLGALAPQLGATKLTGKDLKAWVGKLARSKSADAKQVAQHYANSFA